MSKRKILSSSYYPAPTPAASYSAPDLNLDILLLPSHAVSAKKLRSSSEAAPSMDARVPDRDRPDDDEDDSPATSDSSSDVINTEEEPFPRNNTISAAAPPSAFLFDILRKEGRRIPEAPPPPCNIPTTHQLFPESSSAGGAVTELNLLAAESNQWLKLSEAAGTSSVGGGGEAAAVKPKKSRRGPRSRSSQYRGVTFYRRTGRWESHIWDCGKQVYLGGFDTAHAAARAYDRAAIRFRGVEADINFNLSDYDEDMKAMKDLSKEEFVHVLRRQSTGFSRGSSKYRGGVGVGLQKCGRWEARMGHLLANNNNGAGLLTNFLPRELDTSTTSAGGGVDDLDLRLGMSLNSPHHDGRKSSATARTPLMVDKTTTSSCVDGPSSSSSSSRAAGPFGFQALHGLPISTWTPPPPSSTFDHPEIRSSGQTRAVQGSNNINPFLATTGGGGGGGGFGNGNWAHHQHQLKGVPKWASQQIAASSGFLSSPNYDSNNSKRANAHISSTSSSSSNNATAGGGSSSSTPNVNYPFQPNQYYNWYPHKRAQ